MSGGPAPAPARVAHLCRHPIKAIGHEELGRAWLEAGKAFPHDRRWGVLHAAARPDGEPGGWLPKSNFLRGVAGPELMAVGAELEEAAGLVTLRHPRAEPITVAPDSEAGAAALLAWLRPLWPETRPEPARVVAAGLAAFTDMPESYVAVLNLSSNRALSERLGQPLSIHRWRGNIWLDGLAPWEEFDLPGREITVGGARLKVEERITRCKATTANPETGRADADTLGALQQAYGHQDFGVYARVLRGGAVRCGDRVELS